MSRERSKPVCAPHSPSNAARAALTARSTSSSPASGHPRPRLPRVGVDGLVEAAVAGGKLSPAT